VCVCVLPSCCDIACAQIDEPLFDAFIVNQRQLLDNEKVSQLALIGDSADWFADQVRAHSNAQPVIAFAAGAQLRALSDALTRIVASGGLGAPDADDGGESTRDASIDDRVRSATRCVRTLTRARVCVCRQ
jgi:hypothetical protein